MDILSFNLQDLWSYITKNYSTNVSFTVHFTIFTRNFGSFILHLEKLVRTMENDRFKVLTRNYFLKYVIQRD